MINTIVKTENVTKVYGATTIEVVALYDLSLEIKEGEFVVIQGTSGSGKTTLLNILGALDRPTSGKVVIDGIDTTRVPEKMLFSIRRTKIGFIFQSYYLIPTLTALQNVLVPVLPVKNNRHFHQKAEALLELVGLKDRTNHKPEELSGGEQQRVAIARSLILNPKVILADEPTGNLDSHTSSEVMDLMRTVNTEQKTTFIVVTHDARIAQNAGKIVYLEDGRISDKPI